MRRIGLQLIAEKKSAILAESREKGRGVEKKDLTERDLLTLLIKANLATDIPDNQRLSDEEVLAREYTRVYCQYVADRLFCTEVPTYVSAQIIISVPHLILCRFIVAGHETTSTLTMWALFALTQRPDIQTKLRDELLLLQTDNPTMDELNSLPYLDMVVKETLRHHAPVPMTTRQAVQDDMIPLNQPFTDKRGRVCDHIK